MRGRGEVVLLHGVQSSATTFWRVGADLADLGCTVTALDLAGHGGRTIASAEPLTVAALAADVAERMPDHVDLLVGHSLGAIVALTLAAEHPGRAAAVLVEDPPALGPGLDPNDVATEVERDSAEARADPDGFELRTLADNPLWARADAQHATANRIVLDDGAVAAFLRARRWDLPALVAECPVPLFLLASSGPATALTEPGRSAVLATLLPERVLLVDGGHSLHRDRPGLWVATVLDALERSLASRHEGETQGE